MCEAFDELFLRRHVAAQHEPRRIEHDGAPRAVHEPRRFLIVAQRDCTMMIGITAEEDLVRSSLQRFTHAGERIRRCYDTRFTLGFYAGGRFCIAKCRQRGAPAVRHALFLQKRECSTPSLVDLADGNHHVRFDIEGDFSQGEDRRSDAPQLLFHDRFVQRTFLRALSNEFRRRLRRMAVFVAQGDG